ncbi:MAG TPA: LysM peptidoglycan-binding domain-containing protein, partial [Myxococcaceae bacterium]|nr:LysM peptidoglycan-binding domain-containing protein [Myxococcaceae bacterium]
EVLGGGWQVEQRLRDFSRDSFNLQTLRDVVYSHAVVRSYEPVTTDLVLREVAALLAVGQLRLVRAPPPEVPVGRLFPKLEVVPPPPSVEEEEPKRLMLQIVNDITDDSIADIKLRVVLPDGSEEQVTTDSSGRIELSSVPPGRVKVSSVLEGATLAETLVFVKSGVLSSKSQGAKSGRQSKAPAEGRFLARISEYKVADGDTLERIAEDHELTVDQLTQFNWGTTDPDEIQRRLFVDVGCTLKDDAGKFVLSSDDDPGILYIARPLEMDWVALEDRHVLRVKRVSDPTGFLFSA